ncbi:hypothetical protein GCM10011584_14800 [Nocardioides phosphati]|uniref:Uncharacterized protein n=1 Tax=Nocardioides phosphati TaxID=1867775 RepID=A0ABQ2N906_9ACTN|nr:hypothetical protein [Nocardioides phosphati]GGO88258.1 hypothetical protein GCM10011584_14800 [Nocardioides phosphati]
MTTPGAPPTSDPQQYVAHLVADVASGLAHPPSAAAVQRLVDRVEQASVPGRGSGASSAVRLAVGLLAEDLLRRDPGPARVRRRDLRAPRRGVLLVGAPLAVAATRAASGLPALRPLRPTQVVVLGRPLDEALADAWAFQVHGGVNRTWGGMTATLAARDRIPPRSDAAWVAARWAGLVGAGRVHVVTRPGPLAGVAHEPLTVVHPPVAAAPVELARRTAEQLGILTDRASHARIVAEVLHPLLAREQGPGPRVRDRLEPWLRRHAADIVEGVRAGGYALHGDPADLALRDEGTVRWPGSDHQQPALLAVAVRTLLALCEESP